MQVLPTLYVKPNNNMKMLVFNPPSSGSGDMAKATYDSANISQQVVGLTASQTLTNKTLTAPVFSGTITGTYAFGGTPTFSSAVTATSHLTVQGILYGSGYFYLNGANYQMVSTTNGLVRIIDGYSSGATIASASYTSSQITANQNNYAPMGALVSKNKYVRLSSDASRNVTGLKFTDASVDGEEHYLINVGAFDIVLKHQDTNSTAGNRFINSTGADITLAPNKMAYIVYDGVDSRWRVSLMG